MTHRCLLHLKPWRVLSPLPPRMQESSGGGSLGGPEWTGGGRAEPGPTAATPGARAGWVGGCTGTSLHPTEV